MIQIRTVHPIEAAKKFNKYEYQIDQALQHDYMQDTSLQDAKEAILCNRWHVHEIYDDGEYKALCCTEIHGREYNRNLLNVVVLGGKGLKTWLNDVVEYLAYFARNMGCSGITAHGRKGWARALEKENFKQVSIVMLREV